MIRTLSNAAAKLKLHQRHKRARPLPALWLLTDEKRLPDPTAAVTALPRGCGVILRHYGADRAALALRLAEICKRRGLVFIVAGDMALAAKAGADGLHLPEAMGRRGPSPAALLWHRARGRLLTVAAHGSRGLAQAAHIKADAAVLAPVFATPSHPGRRALGRLRFAALARKSAVPVIALGGINPATMKGLNGSGCAGVAGIGFAGPYRVTSRKRI